MLKSNSKKTVENIRAYDLAAILEKRKRKT